MVDERPAGQRDPLPPPAQRPQRRRADPRQRQAGGDLDRDPRAPDGRGRGLQRARARRHRGAEGEHAGRSRSRDSSSPGPSSTSRARFRAGELHLVKDTPYHFKLHAKDVIHSFWVPQFRMKKDAVPGLTTDIRVTPTPHGTLHARLHRALRARPLRRCARRVIVEDQAGVRPAGPRRRRRSRTRSEASRDHRTSGPGSDDGPSPRLECAPMTTAVAAPSTRSAGRPRSRARQLLLGPGFVRAALGALAGGRLRLRPRRSACARSRASRSSRARRS